MMLKTSISAEIDLSTTIERLSDRERILWVKALLETISEEGTIEDIRDIVNDPQWNDQPQPTEQNEKTTTLHPTSTLPG